MTKPTSSDCLYKKPTHSFDVIRQNESAEFDSREISLANRIACPGSRKHFNFPAKHSSLTFERVTGQGTDGVLQGLVSAEDKPSDSVTSYGAGMVFLAGGLPTLILEIIQAFFPED